MLRWSSRSCLIRHGRFSGWQGCGSLFLHLCSLSVLAACARCCASAWGPTVLGRRDGIPRARHLWQRRNLHALHSERHLVLECPAIQHVRGYYPGSFPKRNLPMHAAIDLCMGPHTQRQPNLSDSSAAIGVVNVSAGRRVSSGSVHARAFADSTFESSSSIARQCLHHHCSPPPPKMHS